MTAKELISDDILPLKITDTGLTAMHWFDEFKVIHLPVVSDNNQFLGLVSEADIFAANSFEEPLQNNLNQLANTSISGNKHIYEALKIMSAFKLTVLPVIDEQAHYMGVISQQTIIEKLAQLTAVDNPGGIVVLELNVNDFSMVEISGIIQQNDARILSMYVNTNSDSTLMKVTIKLNKIDIQPVIQSFNRHGYTIDASFFESDYFDSLRQRYDLLMAYLNV
jgi:CBS domain-containing protein